MKNIFFPLMIPSVLLVLLVLPVNLVSGRSFNNDFETGDLTDWEKMERHSISNRLGVTTRRYGTADSLHSIREIDRTGSEREQKYASRILYV